MLDLDGRDIERVRDNVVCEACSQDLAALVVDDLLEQSRADALRYAPAYLTLDYHRVDHAAAVLTNEVTLDRYLVRPAIDFEGDDVGGGGRGAEIRIVDLGDFQLLARVLRQPAHLRVHGLRQLMKGHRAVRAAYEDGAVRSIEILDCSFEQVRGRAQRCGWHRYRCCAPPRRCRPGGRVRLECGLPDARQSPAPRSSRDPGPGRRRRMPLSRFP